MDIEETVRTRAIEIRQNWNDEQKLKMLLDEWDEAFGHEYDETVEEVLGPYLESAWSEEADKLGSNSLENLLGILLDWPEARFTKEELEGGSRSLLPCAQLRQPTRGLVGKTTVQYSIASQTPISVRGSIPEYDTAGSRVEWREMMPACTFTQCRNRQVTKEFQR